MGILHLNDTEALVFFVNGKKVVDNNVNPEITLISYLREKLHLCGTKLGCAEGGCGACTVMVSKYDRDAKIVKHFAANACLMPVCALHGLAVTTVEGIGSTRTKLHPVQERIAKAHGSQCGFCTPGFVMSMYALLRSSTKPSMKELEIAFQGNLCRCTGYRAIIDGYRTFTKEYEVCGMGDKCCKVNGNGCVEVDNKLFEPSEFVPYDPSQEPIFPPELKLTDKYDKEVLTFRNDRGVVWFRPTELEELMKFKKEHKEATKIVNGNTEVGVEVKFKKFNYKFYVHPSQVKELNQIEVLSNGIKIGAAVTLTDINDFLKSQIKALPEHETRLYRSITEMLHWFAGMQIRNVSSIGGNLMTGSPISDLNPILLAANAELEVQSLDGGRRKLKMDEKFFTGYRRNVIDNTEVLISIFIPKTSKNQYFLAYKQAKRRDDDIAIVNAAFNIKFKDSTNVIEEAKLSFGGMAATTLMATKTAELITNKEWNRELVENVNQSLLEEIKLTDDAVGGVVPYRRSLMLSLFFKAFLKISNELEKSLGLNILDKRERSGIHGFHTLEPKSSQLFEKVSSEQSVTDPIYRPLVHSSAYKHATGEAIYTDDIPRHDNELYLALVLSTKSHAKILSIDPSEALKQPGVHAFFSAKDLKPSQNKMGPITKDEELFASEFVTCYGTIIGTIVGNDQSSAQRAAKLVKVDYEDLLPVIVTVEDAIKHNTYFPDFPKVITDGDVNKAFDEAGHIVEGEFKIGGQEHFYMEPHVALAYLRDGDELEIYASTQETSQVQTYIADMLEIPLNRVVCKAKRLGGGFGGKETRSAIIAQLVALAAYKLKRPVRMAFDRDEDMIITGGRNPVLMKYKAGFMKNGRIIALDIKAYANAGNSLDFSGLVMDRLMFSVHNAYKIPNMRVEGSCMKTNTRSNTAFRGFGSPQGMMIGEHIVRDVARVLNKNILEVMDLNLCSEGDVTHYDQKYQNCNVRRCFEEVKESSDFENRRKAVEIFNQQNRWKKRGITIVNTAYPIGFPTQFLNQGAALVQIYLDGSVLITHGGIEIGQGLFIKTLQVASRVLRIPIERIHIQENATDKIPNSTPTVASMSSDLQCPAVLNACQKLFDRLKPFRENNPEGSWNDWVKAAYFARVSLSATGFYATPDVCTGNGNLYNYFTYGSSVSEVEIDCLTGDHQVIRTDIVMDVGSSLNPAIDIGQIEGGFIQGYGLYVLEELIYSPDGNLYSRGPGMYKIPSYSDIPGEFNVSLLTGAPNPRAVYSSKAIGEPPLFLASSVFFAIKEAIGAARKEENLDPYFYLQAPATAARIRMACQDRITRTIPQSIEGNYKPWNVDL